jgi:hypothetical protein
MQNKVKEIIRKLSIKYNLPEKVVATMVRTPWAVQRKAIEDVGKIEDAKEEDLPVFYHPHFGYFKFSKKKIEKVCKTQELVKKD